MEALVTSKVMKKHSWSTWLKLYPFICIAICFALDAHAAHDKSRDVSIKAGQSCATSSCHPTMGKDKFVHGPVATGDCSFCHKQEKKDRHTFEPIKNVEALCYECHEKLNTSVGVHKPVTDGKCTKCHDPHQSANQFQLKEVQTGGSG
jgi:predicted CXXCH cytochrome family protein